MILAGGEVGMQWPIALPLVYFDQRTHACAWVYMGLHGQKTIKNALKLSKTYFFIMRMRGSCKAYIGMCAKLVEFTQNLSGATSFRVSTSIWESLRNAKKLHFCLYLHISLTWASHTHDEKSVFLIIFKRFCSFSTMGTHAQACICLLKYTTPPGCTLMKLLKYHSLQSCFRSDEDLGGQSYKDFYT